MDPTTVLREQFGGGEKLVAKLLARGIDLVAAGWAKPADRQSWRLFLVVPGELKVRQEASAATDGALAELESEWASAFERVEWSEVQVVPPTDRLAKGFVEFGTHYPRKVASWKGDGMLGDEYVEGAYIYPSALFAKPAHPPATGN